MNRSAKIMTLSVTCVVESIITTHFRNPVEGIASSRSRLTGEEDLDVRSAFSSVAVDSNQNKQVICRQLTIYPRLHFSSSHT